MVDTKKNPKLDCHLNDLVFGISLGEGNKNFTKLMISD